MDNLTKQLVDLICEFRSESVPPELEHFVRDCMLDFIGTTCAGAFEIREKAEKYLKMAASGTGNVPVLGMNCFTDEYSAALLNGTAAHYFELDDGSRFGMIHLGAPVFSALFSVIYAHPVSYERFLMAAIVGYEVSIRLACSIQPAHKKRGFHATGTCGCIGAAAAVAIALDYDTQEIENTLSAATASAGGLLEMISDVSQLKPFNAGKAAQNAIIAAYVGAAGFSGPKDPIGGKRGLFGAMGDGCKRDWLDRKKTGNYVIQTIYRKPYASCRHCHSSVEAALWLEQMFELDSAQIESIEIETYDLAIAGHDHTEIDGTGAAKMSIPYSVAAAIVLNDGGMNAMSEQAVQNEEILTLAKKVHVLENPAYSSLVPEKRIAKVSVRVRSGAVYEKKVTYPKGEPENPMTEDELREKFRQLTSYSGMSRNWQDAVIDCTYQQIFSLEKMKQILIEGDIL